MWNGEEQVNVEQNIISRVLKAQQSIDAADDLIRDYFPFIKSETAKSIGRIPVEGKDDELSIALMGFHEAIENYDQGKGAFLNFASLVIKRRIIDFLRQENQFRHHVSWENTIKGDEMYDSKHVTGNDAFDGRETLKWEIGQLTADLDRLGITISDVVADCPKYDKVIAGCREVIDYLISEPEQMETLVETGKLPAKQLIENTSIKKKTLDKHRKYLVALSVIYFRGYDCMIGHVAEVFKSKKGGKCR